MAWIKKGRRCWKFSCFSLINFFSLMIFPFFLPYYLFFFLFLSLSYAYSFFHSLSLCSFFIFLLSQAFSNCLFLPSSQTIFLPLLFFSSTLSQIHYIFSFSSLAGASDSPPVCSPSLSPCSVASMAATSSGVIAIILLIYWWVCGFVNFLQET